VKGRVTIARKKRIEQYRQRTQQIVTASAQLIHEKGFHGTTLQDVADRLDFTKAALYYYVQDKEDLLFRIHMQTLEMTLAAVEAIVRSERTPPAKLRAFIDNQVRMVVGHPDLFTVYFNEKSHLTEEHAEAATKIERQIVQAITGAIREGVAAGFFHDVDPTVAAFAVMGASSWVYRWYRPQGRLSVEEVSEALQKVMLSGLETTKEQTTERRD
jgi:AcrR family transcriptional regulator